MTYCCGLSWLRRRLSSVLAWPRVQHPCRRNFECRQALRDSHEERQQTILSPDRDCVARRQAEVVMGKCKGVLTTATPYLGSSRREDDAKGVTPHQILKPRLTACHINLAGAAFALVLASVCIVPERRSVRLSRH